MGRQEGQPSLACDRPRPIGGPIATGSVTGTTRSAPRPPAGRREDRFGEATGSPPRHRVARGGGPRRRIMNAKQSLGQRWEASRPTKTLTFWSCAGCAVATIVVGFTWGGWTTGGTARSTAQEAALGSRNELAAAVCVDRFKAAGDAPAQLVALKALGSWDRGPFVEKGGWAAMPVGAGNTDRAARLCGEKLAAVEVPMASAAAVQ